MLYLLDANVLITAQQTYYARDQIPEFWDWLLDQAQNNHVKLPYEILHEITAGQKDDDPLLEWINHENHKQILCLDEEVDGGLVNRVVRQGYAPDLTDDEIEQLGRDPFLIAYALTSTDRCVVTVEVSKPSKQRQNRHIPDVCKTLSVKCCNTFEFTRALGFKTSWRS